MHKIRYIYVQIIRELMLELVYHFCVGCVIQWNGYAEREIRREICGAAGSGRINIIFTMNICWDCGTWVSLYCTNMKTNEIARQWKDNERTHTCIRILHTTRQKLDSLITTNWQQRLYWAIFPCHLLFLFLFLLLLNSVRVIETIIAFSFERKE